MISKMGKHRNPQQEKIFIDFMESHVDIARGYVKGDRVVKEALWADLAKKLNSCGPPTKDLNGWKKTWADWKVYVKNKMSHNKKENLKTGGGQYNKYVLSDAEETVTRLTGIYRSVDGINSSKDFGESTIDLILNESEKESECDIHLTISENNLSAETPSTSKKRISRTPSPNPKRCRPNTPQVPSKAELNSLLAEENNHLKSITKLMEEHLEEAKILNKKLDMLCNIFENQYKARQLNDIETQKQLREKNELKLKLIEIETLKLSIEREKVKHS
ncbi:hypothetical protein CVS40_12557 [Lucilia cuprina]|nr:hypothetical protein CVS40_12557 [Lucilia cuprina]